MSNSHAFDSSASRLAFLAGGGEMGRRIRAFDWSSTPLGAIETWPQSLRSALSICLNSNFPIAIYWGPELVLLYNDDWSPIPGKKHPWTLGQRARDAWPEIWHIIEPRLQHVLKSGEPFRSRDQLLPMHRYGFTEECYFDYTFTPIRGEDGTVQGIFNAGLETTNRVVGERRLRTLRELSGWETGTARSVSEACDATAAILCANPQDIPFAALYLSVDDSTRLVRRQLVGLSQDHPALAIELDRRDALSVWPLDQLDQTLKSVVMDDLVTKVGELPGGAWPESVRQALLLPLFRVGLPGLSGVAIVGVSPRLPLDDEYRGFFDLLGGHIGSAISNAHAYEEERQRAESLAELDRAKTAFFSNVSHEFRTPLTLMLGPLENVLSGNAGPISPTQEENLQLVHRNGLRLQRLVNTLLEFSRIEAGRERATFRPVDLATLTADLASNFRSACENAGLKLTVTCPALPQPVYVDHQMWERIVLNLVSNAFKFTLNGEIEVQLDAHQSHVELQVRDTGVGIPESEMPRLFERFHRIEAAGGRTHEGSGIGLALVHELVRLHGGTIRAESSVGVGTRFVVTLPLGTAHLPDSQVRHDALEAASTSQGRTFVDEALRWLPTPEQDASFPAFTETERGDEAPAELAPLILVADDNADLRHYITRLIADEFRVVAVSDGQAALSFIQQEQPDLILSDVMMPRLDGFGLLQAIRNNPRTASVPVIFLSARAGEESRVEGLKAGADDYLVKPFAARELHARINALLRIARVRRESDRAIRLSEERYRLLFETMTEGFAIDEIIFDEAGAGRDLRFLEVNPSFERHIGLPREQIVGHTALELFPTTEAFWFEQYGNVATTGKAHHFQARFGPLDRWYDVSAYPLGNRQVATVFTDITEKYLAEEALRTSEARFRHLADAMPQLVWVAEGSGRVLYYNSRRREFSGMIQNSDGTWKWEPIVHPDDLVATEAAWEASLARTIPYQCEHRLQMIDGSFRWHLSRAFAFDIKDEGGLRWYGTATDVHDLKAAQQALRIADQRKDEFLATLAHELRNPLAPIRNGLQVLKLGGNRPDLMDQARAMMERQLSQMVHLVDDLLDVSRISRGKIELRRQRVELSQIIQQAIETSRPAIEHAGHNLTVKLASMPIYLDGDTTRLAQVFSNLLNNAAKYTERGGGVSLEVHCTDQSEVRVTVSDTGIGIPPEMLPKVFDMFTQVDRNLERSHSGLGIGLSIVKRLVEMHGGTITAHSAGHGMGSQFVVRLPTEPSAEPCDHTSPA